MVTAGFIWAPPMSPKASIRTVTTKPMARAMWMVPPCKIVSPQSRGTAHCTVSRINVATT